MLLAATTFIVACKSEPKVDYVLLSGKIENPAGKTVVVSGPKLNHAISLNNDNTFADTLRLASIGYYTLLHGRESSSIFLNNGDDLSITLNTSEFDESITYDGVGAKANNYLAAKYIHNEQNAVDIPTLYAKEEKDFLNEVNKIKALNEEFLNNAEGLDKEFKALEMKSNEYDYLLNVQQYPSYHSYFTKKENVETSNEFNAIINGITYDNEKDYQSFQSYQRMVQNHYGIKVNEGKDIEAVFNEIKNMNAPTIKENLARQFAYYVGPTNENNEVIYKGVSSISSDEKFKAALKTKYEKMKLLAKGMPSPVFTNYENHKGGETSLEDLRGKYVYVDVWATWCGPCKREIPYLKEIETKYEGKNIEFVSTSIDRAQDHEAWRQMVIDKELKGIQLFADNDWQSEFVKGYAIEGIPRFILIDPNGNIVSADAPRPSDPKLVDLFNELKI